MEKLKMDHGEVSEKIMIADYDMIEKRSEEVKFERDWLKRVRGYISQMKEKEGYELLVIDSIDALYSLATIKETRKEIYYFFKGLREIGITSLLVSEMSMDSRKYSHYGVEDFLSDGIMHIEFQKKGDVLSTLERSAGIVKMRSTDHDTQYFPLLYMGNRFRVFGRDELELE
jgi:KaiC/GvpD/RAD55 family RecA-like ATPase